MADFLERMARASAARAAQAFGRLPEGQLLARALSAPPPKPLRLEGSGFDLIAEFKRRAPSAGTLSDGVRPMKAAEAARRYVEGGAAAVSVLTEPEEFSGSLEDLAAAAGAVAAPVMRKDFLVDPRQVLEARAHGASGVLLILRLLDQEHLEEMLAAARAASLFVLLEAFDEADLARISEAGVRTDSGGPALLVGLNCRDLATLRTEPERLVRLRGAFPHGPPGIAESGLETEEDARRVARLGYRAALVGSALMRAVDPAARVSAMLRAGRREAALRAVAPGEADEETKRRARVKR